MTNIEFIEKQVERLESLIEVAKKCCDESLAREAEKKIEKNKQVIADLKKLEMLEKDLKYLANQEIEQFVFPNGRTILGVDITSMPSEKEKIKRMIERTLKEVLGNDK